MNETLLWGAGSQARIIKNMIEEDHKYKYRIHLIFDPTMKNTSFETSTIFSSCFDHLSRSLHEFSHFIIGIGSEFGYARYRIHTALANAGFKPLSIKSKYGFLDSTAVYGSGLIAMPGAIVQKFSRLGDQCILNTNSVVDHECEIGNGVHIMGGASIAGRVKIGDFSTIGTNATILPDIKIGKGVFVGAGAVVTKNISDFKVVMGVPSRIIRANELKIHPSIHQLEKILL